MRYTNSPMFATHANSVQNFPSEMLVALEPNREITINADSLLISKHAQSRIQQRTLGIHFLEVADSYGRTISQPDNYYIQFLDGVAANAASSELRALKTELEIRLKQVRRELKIVKSKLRQCKPAYAVIADNDIPKQKTLVTIAHYTGSRKIR